MAYTRATYRQKLTDGAAETLNLYEDGTFLFTRENAPAEDDDTDTDTDSEKGEEPMATEVFKHGVYTNELPTSLVPPSRVAMPTVAIGTAPGTATASAPVNKPVLCNTYAEFVEEFGWSEDFENYTLCEAAYVHFALFNVAPLVCINVYDSKANNAKISDVTATTIIGGIDSTSGKNTGLECIEDVYPRLGVVPGTLIAPKFSETNTVAAALKAKCKNINGCFNTICAVDIPTATVKKYGDVQSYKSTNNLSDANTIVCWPLVSLGGVKYHLSTQVAALMSLVDSQNDDMPFVSPSNKSLQTDMACLSDGTEIFLPKSSANYLNSIGVVTALNFAGMWRCWGNSCSSHPVDTDPVGFIPVKRMIAWLGNTLVTTYFSRIDSAMNKRLIESVTESSQVFLNGLASRGAILGGRIEFRETDNPTTDLISGVMKFHLSVGFVVPAQVITFDIEFDPNYYATLFE